MADTHAPPALRSLLTVCTCILGILVVASLSLARVVLLPLALAILLTFILTPLVIRLQRRGLGRGISVTLVSSLAFVIVGGFVFIIAIQLRNLAVDLPGYRENINRKFAALREVGPGNVVERIQNTLSDIFKELSLQAPESAEVRKPMPVVLEQGGPARLGAILGPALELLAQVLLVTMLVIFMLASHEDLRDRFIRLIGRGRLRETTRALEDASQRVSRFLLMQLLTNVVFGLTLGTGLFFIGLPQAFLWGLLVGALRFIPYLGSPFGGLMLVVLSVAVFPGWQLPLAVFGLFLFLEVLTANVLEPVLYGHSTGVSPLALLFAAAFWTWLWGPAGLLLSTPLTVCLVVVGRYVPGLQFLGVLLSDRPALTLGQRYYQRMLAHDPDEAIDLVEQHLKTEPREPFYDKVLLPALVLARQDRDRGTLSPGDEQALLQHTRQILDEIVPVPCPNSRAASGDGPVVLGIPTGDEAEELALDMLKQLLEADGCRLTVLPAQTPISDVRARVARENPVGVCVVTLPPEGLAAARYLCKRLRMEFPELKLLVGRWGEEDGEQARQRLQAAGADAVATTLQESYRQVRPLLRGTSGEEHQPEPAEPAVASASS